MMKNVSGSEKRIIFLKIQRKISSRKFMRTNIPYFMISRDFYLVFNLKILKKISWCHFFLKRAFSLEFPPMGYLFLEFLPSAIYLSSSLLSPFLIKAFFKGPLLRPSLMTLSEAFLPPCPWKLPSSLPLEASFLPSLGSFLPSLETFTPLNPALKPALTIPDSY